MARSYIWILMVPCTIVWATELVTQGACCTVQPGWKWSKDIKPIVGTESCQAKHIGVIVEGTVTCRHNDGTEVTYSGGDAYAIEPGHDAWVVGDKPAVAYEFHGAWGE